MSAGLFLLCFGLIEGPSLHWGRVWGIVTVPGVLVAAISNGGPAEAAGLRIGDVVLKLDGEATPSVDAVHKILTREKIGRRVALDVLRDGVMVRLQLAVAERPDERRSA